MKVFHNIPCSLCIKIKHQGPGSYKVHKSYIAQQITWFYKLPLWSPYAFYCNVIECLHVSWIHEINSFFTYIRITRLFVLCWNWLSTLVTTNFSTFVSSPFWLSEMENMCYKHSVLHTSVMHSPKSNFKTDNSDNIEVITSLNDII